MRKKLIINSLSGGAQLFIGTLLLLIAVPVFIKKLGIELYGIYSLILVVNSFSVFLGLGINSGLIKFLAEQGKSKESDIDVVVASSLLILVVLPFTLLGLLFNEFILKNILKIPVQFINNDTKYFFDFLIIGNVFQFLGQIPVAILDSLQKIYLTSIYQFIYQASYWTLTISAIFLFGSLKMIGLGIFLSILFWLLLLMISTNKHWGKLSLNFNLIDIRRSLKKQIGYTYKLYITQIINFFYEPLTKILISSFLGVTQVGYFDIILKVRTQIWNILIKLLYPLFPFISKLKDEKIIRNLIHDIEQKLIYVILLVISIIVFIIPGFVRIWLKNDISEIYIGMILIVSANLLAIIVVPLYQYLTLKKPEKTIILQSLNVMVNLILFFLFYKSLGFMAAILGNVCAILSSTTLSIYYQKRYMQSLIFNNFNQFSKTILLFIILMSIAFIINILIKNELLEIFILPLILLFFDIIFIRLLKLISKDDIIKYSGSNQRIENILTKIFI